MPRVVVVRHGSTESNRGGGTKDRIRGWSNPPLDKRGQEEAAKLAKELAQYKIGLILTSDFARADATANTIAGGQEQRPQVHPTPELRAWNMGKMNGAQVTDAVVKQIQFYVTSSDTPVPGGESFHDFVARTVAFLEKTMKAAAQHLGPEDTLALVTHARNIELIALWLDPTTGGGPDQLQDAWVHSHPDRMVVEPDTVKPGGFLVAEWNGKQWNTTSKALPKTSKVVS